MKVKKSVEWVNLSVTEKAGFIGKRSEGFILISENVTKMGVVEVSYTYSGWGFAVTTLIVPVLDSGYCQIVEVD